MIACSVDWLIRVGPPVAEQPDYFTPPKQGSFPMWMHRLTHYALLLAAMALLTLPNLGVHSLWDVDEGVNAEAAREMMEAGRWISPHFNFELRTAKPALLYWLQMASYSVFGVTEFGARFPSVLAGMSTVLMIYELARRMFGVQTGLLAGIVLASAFEFCMLSHAATPDSTLLLFTVLTYFLFWILSRNGSQTWIIPCSMAAGLAVLTKGPVGIVMPAVVIFLHLLWNRQLSRLLDRRLIWGFLAFLLVAAPWYILVTVETRGAWIKQFIGRENVTRFMQPMENHQGPIYYHILGVMVLFAPWSIFLAATIWYSVKEARRASVDSAPENDREACRFLLCWLATYLGFFSIAATKLPNYVLPVYPALAILTARFLEQWRTGRLTLPRWIMPAAAMGLLFVGVVTGMGLAIAGGLIAIPGAKMRLFPGVERWLWLGLVPIGGAIIAGAALLRTRKTLFVSSMGICATAFVALVAALPVLSFDEYKAPRKLVAESGVRQAEHDSRLLALQWFQPSVVFYSRREVERINNWVQAADTLALRLPVYLFVPEPVWKQIQEQKPKALAYRTVARQYDFLKNCDILVVTNQ
ncbi:MAG: glycosyltransferase family 39 protein [Planctomycetes bacterium]|nr:glycosyltransferase family 39 protein [Planctomycetota bacterium]